MEVALRCTSGPKPVPTMGTVLQAVALSYRGLMQELDTGLNVWKQGSQRHGCAPTWSWTPSCHVGPSQQVTVNGSMFLVYVHRVPFDQVNAISIKGGVNVFYIRFQVRLHPALVPRGFVWGPVPLGVLLCEPKVPASPIFRWFWVHTSGCPSLSFCRCLCLGHPLRLLD